MKKRFEEWPPLLYHFLEMFPEYPFIYGIDKFGFLDSEEPWNFLLSEEQYNLLYLEDCDKFQHWLHMVGNNPDYIIEVLREKYEDFEGDPLQFINESLYRVSLSCHVLARGKVEAELTLWGQTYLTQKSTHETETPQLKGYNHQRIFTSLEAENLFFELIEVFEIKQNKKTPLAELSTIYRAMVMDGYIYERIGDNEFREWLRSNNLPNLNSQLKTVSALSNKHLPAYNATKKRLIKGSTPTVF